MGTSCSNSEAALFIVELALEDLKRTKPPRILRIWILFLGKGCRVLLRFDNLISHRVTDQFTHGVEL
jgi:hypothetical protein